MKDLRLDIAEQFEHSLKKTVKIAYVDTNVDYCLLRGSWNTLDRNIMLVTGFGSGWTGIAELAYYLAILGWNVGLVSLPGYGNSDDPPKSYYAKGCFSSEAIVLAEMAECIFPGKKVHFVGHSMGAAIITELAYRKSWIVASLTMINPAGFEMMFWKSWLVAKFVVSGILHRLTFRGETAFPKLRIFLPHEKKSLSKNRLMQRYSELRRICNGSAMTAFCAGRLGFMIPVFYVTGERDFVVPAKKSALIEFNNKYGGKMLKEVVVLNGYWHNTTLLGSDKTAQAIERLLRSVD
jgi:pimeloyl-ACP methyl ester carboxylesterase